MGYGGLGAWRGGRGDRPHDEQPHISPQKHTDELQAQAQSSLLRLVCQLYQVGRGWGWGRGRDGGAGGARRHRGVLCSPRRARPAAVWQGDKPEACEDTESPKPGAVCRR